MDNMNGIDPKYLALIQAGLGILAGNNGRQPVGAAIGQGLLGGVGGYQDGLQNQQMMAMRQNQYDQQQNMFAQNQEKYNRELKNEQTQKAAKARLLRGQDGYMQVNDGSSYEQDLVDSGYGDMMFKQQFNKNADPYFTPIPTDKGMARFNNRTGGLELITLPNGQTVVKSSDSPDVRGSVKAAESLAAAQYKPNTDIDGIVSTDAQVAQQSLGSDGGIKVPTKAENKAAEVKAEASAKSQIELPKVIDQANQTYQLVEDLITHPGLKPAVGLSSKLDPRNYIAGTSAADFKVRLDQLQGQQFLQAFESLKGGGQITEVEGKKATDAMARMNTSQTEEEFIKSAKEFQSVIKAGLERSKAKAGGNQIMPNTEPMPQSDKPAPKSLVKGQKYKGWTYTGGNTAEERADPKNWTR